MVSSVVSPFAQLAQQAARQEPPARISDLRSLAEAVARQAQASRPRPTTARRPTQSPQFRLPQSSPDPTPPTYGAPVAAPNFSDQAYRSPARRYSEAEIRSALAQEFALMAQASRSAAQDQAFVESSRLRNQRALQGDLLATQRYLADVQALTQRRVADVQALTQRQAIEAQRATQRYLADVQALTQRQAIEAQRAATQNAFTNTLTALQFQLAQTPRTPDASRFVGGPTTVRQIGGSIQIERIPSSRNGERPGLYDPAALAREQLAAQAARQAVDLAARLAQQQADIASRERLQAASIQGQKDLQQQSRELEDELRRRAAMRALQVFNQASPTGRQINLVNQGRV